MELTPHYNPTFAEIFFSGCSCPSLMVFPSPHFSVNFLESRMLTLVSFLEVRLYPPHSVSFTDFLTISSSDSKLCPPGFQNSLCACPFGIISSSSSCLFCLTTLTVVSSLSSPQDFLQVNFHAYVFATWYSRMSSSTDS